MAQERRTQVFTGPGFDNRPFRKGKTMGFSQKQRADLDMNDPQQFARAMRDMGAKMGPNGEMVPTQNWGGLMGKASQQMNSLSRDARAGEGSGLGGPANTMYDRDPTFFNRGGNAGGAEGFGQMLAQTREQRIAQAQQEGTFGTIRDKYNLDNADKGMQMNEFGNLIKNAGAVQTPYRPGLTGPTVQSQMKSQAQNRAGLQEAVTGKKLLQEAQQPPMQITEAGGGKNLAGKYGTGWSAPTTPGKKNESLIGGRPFSEVMQGLANKPGLARKEDKFQPQQWGDILKKKAKTK